ncbi:MAG: aldehyde dehydrogenase family protein, partial [Mesorhizobium sp.]
FGLHTRIEDRAQHFVDGIHAGNIYVNRNQIGAVVGSQPFGGEGLSGTGPKAGGPHYLRRFRKGPEAGTPILDGRKVTATELADNLPDPTLGGWSTRADRIAVLRKHLRGKGAAAIGAALRVDLVAFSGTPEAARIVRKVIADRAGPIVPLVSEVLNPAAYAHERAVCVDTTAAGGNASLLAAA